MNYNYFRDYDPVTGRHVESDPIGLAGGLNTFLYAAANPLQFIDPLGLTEQDIEAMRALANRLETDLPVPKRVIVRNLRYGSGFMNPITRRVIIDDYYLRELSLEQVVDLYDLIVHETIHRDRPWNAIRHPINHPDVYDEARRRAAAAREAIEQWYRETRGGGVCP